jgi:uncharacterized protein
MARPQKWRNVCCLPLKNNFGPLSIYKDEEKDSIIMTVDEYETIRLIDLENLTQAECSNQMNIARTTVQGIYNDARRKLADSLVNGRPLIIQGGNYKLCNQYEKNCQHKKCHKHVCKRDKA